MNSSAERFRQSTSETKGNGAPFVKEDSASRLAGEEEADLGDAVLCKSSLRETSFYFEGVRFSPKIIEFIDAFEGKQFAVKLKIQNVDKKPVLVRVGEPNSFIFQLKRPSRRVRLLASGSSLTKTITYSYHNDDLVQKSQIPIQINGRYIDYPIVVKKAAPEISVEPTQLDFKQINLGASAKTVLLTIHNSGGKRTKFEIDLGKNDLDLVVTPVRGTIKAKSKVTVVVEMMGMTEGEYFKELWVTTNEMSTRVPIVVEVVRPRLEIVHPNVTEDFVLIDFSPTFANTQKAEPFLLKNYSADTTLFITLVEMGNDLQFLNDARKHHETCKVFMFTAEEGRLEPFESRVLTALFRPKGTVVEKGWHRGDKKGKNKRESRLEHIVFVRMTRVHCIEIKELAKVEARPTFNTVRERSDSGVVQSTTSLQPPFAGASRMPRTSHYISELLDMSTGTRQSSGSLMPSLEDKVLRLCLHGTAVEPNVTVQPSSFEFQPADVGSTQNKVLLLKNESVVAIKYNVRKLVNVEVSPHEGWLQPDEALELLISVTPTSGGKFDARLHIEILGKSDVVFEHDKDLVAIDNLFVPLSYVANIVPPKLVPKIGFGITPLITDDAGFLKELVTFGSDCVKPRAAVLSTLSRAMRPEWMKKEADKAGKVDNAIIAFPNDRPRKYYSWTKENICRTIFKGFFRYSPPEDAQYTLTPEQMSLKRKNYLVWKDYLKVLQEVRAVEERRQNEDSDLCQNWRIATPSTKPFDTEKLAKKLKAIVDKKITHPKNDLVPLSPQHLNNINVEPKLINFGTVALNNLVHETLTVYNMNPFPIGIRFVPGKTAVKVVEGDTIIVSPLVTKTLAVSFETMDLGRHYGFLNYVINGSHQFKITISAYVTSKTLMLEDKNLVIEFGNYPAENAFQPRGTFLELGNLLQSPISYQWQLPADSAFVPDNIRGEVPPRTQLITEINFDMHPKKSFYSELNLISESGSSELIKLIYPSRNVAVFFLSSRIDVGDVPLNLPTKVIPVIQNACYHGVVFEVSNWNPIPGVVVQPRQGVLKPRSFLSLEVIIQIPVIMNFSFDIVVFVHLSQKISVKITGNVVVPMIRIKPTEVVMRKICSNSFDTVSLCIENAGTTAAEVDIDLQGCPEYEVVDDKSHLFLLPSSHSKVNVRFQPKDVARYVFYLPIIVNRILGPAMMQEPQTEHISFYIASSENLYDGYGKVYRSENSKLKVPCVCINSTVSLSLLTISSPNVNFRPLRSPDSNFQCQTIVVSNDFVDEVTFCLRTDDLGDENDSPFNLLPVNDIPIELRSKAYKVTLKQGEKLVLNATFSPKNPGRYEVRVPIFIRGYSNGVVYNYLCLRGELKKPSLHADSDEIHFPPLPLNVGCDVIISVSAEDYSTHDTISCLVWRPPDGTEVLSKFLSVTWLDEPRVSPLRENQAFQVQITFRSTVPVALRNYLVFIDSSGNHCTVLVTAVADNSVMTTHAFLRTRTSKYRLVRDAPLAKQISADSTYPIDKEELKTGKFGKRGNNKRGHGVRKEGSSKTGTASTPCFRPVDKGSRLVVQATKSMTRITQLSFVNPAKNSFYNKTKECGSIILASAKSRTMNSVSQSDSYSTAQSNDRLCKDPEPATDVTHPDFPFFQDTPYGKHFQETLQYLERWMFEVVMKCDQYFEIPKSFQKVRNSDKREKSGDKHSPKNKANTNKNKTDKDFLDFLEEILDPDMKESLPQRVSLKGGDKQENLFCFFADILNFLSSQGCMLPHVRPEYLMKYDDYIIFVTNHCTSDVFQWQRVIREKKHFFKSPKESSPPSNMKVNIGKTMSISSSSIFNRGPSWGRSFLDEFKIESNEDNMNEEEEEEEKFEEVENSEIRWNLVEDRQFVHETPVLDKTALEARSAQSWFDIVIQIFRVFVLSKVNHVPGIPETEVIGLNDQFSLDVMDVKSYGQKAPCEKFESASLESNLYSVQERLLLMWLNENCANQRDSFWRYVSTEEPPPAPRPINNFDRDLADSMVLILVTAAYCPYIVNQYFSDVFVKADTQSKMCHNAGKLTLAWKTLNLGLTVESMDLVNPNPAFLIVLVVQLYKVLPTLYPRYQVNFASPLSSDSTRTITIKNEYQSRVFYQLKFMGEHEGLFRLRSSSPMVVMKPLCSTDINVTFTARRIKKVSAILILCGYVISPTFVQHLCFRLEGEPSDLRECTKLSFSTPLYKVLCTEIPVRPPYAEPTTYDIWYSTNRPTYQENSDISYSMKPWSKIWNRKVARRLFLNRCEISVSEGGKSANLGVAVACMTEEERNFWLLFRSFKVGDFIILVSIKANVKSAVISLNAFFSDSWSKTSECLCPDGGKTLQVHDSNSGGHCPFIVEVDIPVRNHLLWDSVKNMFLRTLHVQEKSFWSKHFEKNIGLCLVLWFIQKEEEEDVAEEFIHILQTRIVYALRVEPPNHRYLTVPSAIEIPDVRRNAEMKLPIHVSPAAPDKLKAILTMTSEDGKEVRRLKITLAPPPSAAPATPLPK